MDKNTGLLFAGIVSAITTLLSVGAVYNKLTSKTKKVNISNQISEIDKIKSEIDIYDKMIVKLKKESDTISAYITENMMGTEINNFDIGPWRDKQLVVTETWKSCEVHKKMLTTKLEVLTSK